MGKITMLRLHLKRLYREKTLIYYWMSFWTLGFADITVFIVKRTRILILSYTRNILMKMFVSC